MFNFKISGAAAGIAFIFSLILGFFSGAGLLILFLRALIFGAVFFGLSCLVFWILAQYLPEILNIKEDELGFPVSGSRVDISLGDEKIAGAFPIDNSEIVDDISGKPSTQPRTAVEPLDQRKKAEYNKEGGIEGDFDALTGLANMPDSGIGTAGKAGSMDTLADMDGFTDNTLGSSSNAADKDTFSFESSEPGWSKSSSKQSGLSGDFDPKELAQAIKTVLNRDGKG